MTSLDKVSEKSELARKIFFSQAVKKTARVRDESEIQEVANELLEEYTKAFGRIGIQPMLSIKGGKQEPRYLLNREEVWVLYKPPLWQMGSSLEKWKENVEKNAKRCSSLREAQLKMMSTNQSETLQEWHGLCQGMKWLPPDDSISEWGFVQRLDLETDGPVLIAKTWRAQRFLHVQMKNHVFSKAYICLVHGRVADHVHHVKCKFASLGAGGGTQVMLKYDSMSDPWYNLHHTQQKWKTRDCRWADTFFKPMAYYQYKDGSEYSLVYVNILSGITHQIRITMQSVGHPLVSDDRYLPKDQAMKDITWCPRNFLCEVRQDWFDMCGPHRDPKRRGYTRVSIENPLPKLFQDLLEKKLKLIQNLDESADLLLGGAYWAIGDEELMIDNRKDDDYRKKVYRWGARRRIHREALDRLLLLKKEEIDKILSEYKRHSDPDEETWVCTNCMQLNMPGDKKIEDEEDDQPWNHKCIGGKANKTKCEARRWTKQEEVELKAGWRDYLEDPTLHMLMLVNPKWCEARRNAFQSPRVPWEKVPMEEEGDVATEEQCEALLEHLQRMARAGGYGLQEEDLVTVPGLEKVKLPLRLPKDCDQIRRTRLPGSCTGSSWTYNLSGKERFAQTQSYNCATKMMREPVKVETGKLLQKMKMSEDQRNELDVTRQNNKRKAEDEGRQKREKDAEDERYRERELDEQMQKDNKRRKKEQEQAQSKRKWQRVESTRNVGTFYYMDRDTGETRTDMPPDYKEAAPVWEKKESSSQRGKVYYYNEETGESREERPRGVKILNDDITETKASEQDWKRIESSSKPGEFYYFNSKTGASEEKPPHVKPPWQLLPSRSKKGQFYYFHEETGETSEHPPNCAVPAQARTKAPLQASSLSSTPQPATVAGVVVPAGWEKIKSTQHSGKFYYRNVETQETRWTVPQWERIASSSSPGKFYYKNVVTGKTTWIAEEAKD
mmetsp:Transcript_80819/g.142538  ORF Transcript_80819/g.142538 Transcript_80819/m.142538 type:complete len:952 (+) Transcript_80819:71-2926(+)|eukprot:CAMPEP_0197630274 /NCGR_PEP_ID=MMETSP1338-20131121/7820_1 /TAXON_ID=43686 ORGANISM="Pelagodinium beii, Strain RCC1491" /NCGR_SAMPLE_ID=MMETSP1338 /ASSEMBLY_ACC=CAM_ASM_000754 /LENGTH=951 /DNA_ID=CAMNT_0043201463 /DNA_START=71 /DNA_END=2926 /DNA_ORIENTATION=+